MSSEVITRAQADNVMMSKTAKFGVLSDGCTGVWGDGVTEAEALENARRYFCENKQDFLNDDYERECRNWWV